MHQKQPTPDDSSNPAEDPCPPGMRIATPQDIQSLIDRGFPIKPDSVQTIYVPVDPQVVARQRAEMLGSYAPATELPL